MKERKGELMDKLSIKRFFAFTLAETLIVMGIIGVVAALTIPNLNSSTADKEKVAKLKKVYSNLEDAVGRSEAVYGPISDWEMDWNSNDSATKVAERLGDFLKVSKTCGLTANSACMPTSVKNLAGSNDNVAATGNTTWTYKYILADGTGLGIKAMSGVIVLTVDLDGPTKGSSTLGKDMFSFYILGDLPTYTVSTNAPSERRWRLLTDATVNGLTSVTNLTSYFKDGGNLATWVIQNDNMDYLKATEGKCKNNTSRVLSWTNTSCK